MILNAEQTQAEKDIILAEHNQERGVSELHWVEPRFMTEEEMRRNPRYADLYDLVV